MRYRNKVTGVVIDVPEGTAEQGTWEPANKPAAKPKAEAKPETKSAK